MSAIIPTSRPRISHADFVARARAQFPDLTLDVPFLIAGIRGYYRDTVGVPGQNDLGHYDDAICLITPNVFASWNANVDPSRWRQDIAQLAPGYYLSYRFDVHRGTRPHPAICQRAGDVVVYRHGTATVPAGTRDHRGLCLGHGLWRGRFGINIHEGGRVGTSSLGCTTLPPVQWPDFYSTAAAEARRIFGSKWQRVTIPYLLLA